MSAYRNDLERCWWCGGSAETQEHRIKRSDLVAEFGSEWPEALVHVRGDEPRGVIKSPNSQRVKFSRSLCARCNNERSQPFDEAYRAFGDFAFAHEEEILRSRVVDLRSVYGAGWRRSALDLARYVVKRAGCQIAEHQGKFGPLSDLTPFLNGGRFPRWLALDFAVNEDKLLVSSAIKRGGKSAEGFVHGGSLHTQFSPSQNLHFEPQSSFGRRWLEIYWGIAVEAAPRNPLSRRRLQLGFVDSELEPELRSRLIHGRPEGEESAA